MDRLTYRLNSGAANLCKLTVLSDEAKKSAARQNAFNRLAAYEDTGLMPDEINEEISSREDYIIGLNAVIEKMRFILNKINNIAIEWVESGPYEDANAESLKKMCEIEKLSRIPQPPKGKKQCECI